MREAQRRILAARVIAVVADAVQLGLFPLFAGGAPEVLDAVLDVAVGAALIALLGWHWAFLPAFLAELVPGVDLAPTWTLAVVIATRRAGWSGNPPDAPTERPLLPPFPAPLSRGRGVSAPAGAADGGKARFETVNIDPNLGRDALSRKWSEESMCHRGRARIRLKLWVMLKNATIIFRLLRHLDHSYPELCL